MKKTTAARARELLTAHPKISAEWLVRLLEKEQAPSLDSIEGHGNIPSQWDRELAALLVLDEHRNEQRAHGYRIGALDMTPEVQIIMRHRITAPNAIDNAPVEALKLISAICPPHMLNLENVDVGTVTRNALKAVGVTW